MGNIVESLAFIPPDRPEAHEQMKVDNGGNLKIVKNSVGNDVALLWYSLDAEYTVLYSHGNAEDLAGSRGTFEDLALSLECNVCAYDYSGYGLSGGQCSEQACYSDIEAVYDFLVNTAKVKPTKIILFGRSLGSGPTIHLASKHPNLAGMILQSPLRTAIKTQMPDWVGYVFKKIDIFANERKVPKINSFPVFVIHGTVDNVVPYSHGKYLYDLLHKFNHDPSAVLMYSVEGCGHNDIEYRKGRELKRKLKKFVNNYIRNRKDSRKQNSYSSQNDALEQMQQKSIDDHNQTESNDLTVHPFQMEYGDDDDIKDDD
jgi:hypothetical protein